MVGGTERGIRTFIRKASLVELKVINDISPDIHHHGKRSGLFSVASFAWDCPK